MPEGMVATEHHTQKLEARDRLTNNAKPIEGRRGKEGGGETANRGARVQRGSQVKQCIRISSLLTQPTIQGRRKTSPILWLVCHKFMTVFRKQVAT